MKTPSAAGKGDDNRISDYKKYRENFDSIFKQDVHTEILKGTDFCPRCDFACDKIEEDSDFCCCPFCGIEFDALNLVQ